MTKDVGSCRIRVQTGYKEEFYKDLKQLNVPPGTEHKYKHTIDFFSHCENETLDMIKKYYHNKG